MTHGLLSRQVRDDDLSLRVWLEPQWEPVVRRLHDAEPVGLGLGGGFDSVQDDVADDSLVLTVPGVQIG